MQRTVLITGVSNGIGKATGEVFVKAGWKVIGVDKQKPHNYLDSIHFLKGDVSDPKLSKNLFKEVARIVEKLDALVNNAAVQICKPFVEMDICKWDSIMASNVRSIYLSVRHAYKLIRKPGGAVVNVASIHAIATSTNIAAYAASKGAVLSLTRALGVELAKNSIRVNAVLPGAVDTRMLRIGLNRGHLEGDNLKGRLRSLAKSTPLGRIGKPEEIAQSILFLADNQWSSFITGQALVVDGGALARLSTE